MENFWLRKSLEEKAQKNRMLPRKERLTTRQFDRAFSNSQQVRHPLVSLRAHFRGDGSAEVRAAFVVPKKQAKKATQRNLIRRRLRERYRLHPARNLPGLQGCDLIFMATPQTADASLEQLDAALEEALRRAAKKNPNSGNGASGPKHYRAPVEAAPEVTEPGQGEVEKETESAAQVSRSWPVTAALGLIRFYQRFISPGLPPSCRFEPTCSRYTYASIERFGLLRGCLLGAARVCRCNPLCRGGYDPVPQDFPFLLSRSQK